MSYPGCIPYRKHGPQTFERAKITEDSEYIIKPFSDSDLHIGIEMAYHKFGLHNKDEKQAKIP